MRVQKKVNELSGIVARTIQTNNRPNLQDPGLMCFEKSPENGHAPPVRLRTVTYTSGHTMLNVMPSHGE